MDAQATSDKADSEPQRSTDPATGVDHAGADAQSGPAGAEALAERLQNIEKGVDRIAEQLADWQRSQQSRDFNLSHLAGAVVQVVAVALMLGAMLALLKSQPDYPAATLALLGAIAAQLLAMTLFSFGRPG